MLRSSLDDSYNDHDRIQAILKDFHNRLQDAGLKSTRQRDLIVGSFFDLDQHITVDELLDHVRKVQPRIGYATVYRTLKLLVDQGFALPKEFGDRQTRYDPIHNQNPHHDHLICVDCRRIIEFEDNTLAMHLAEIARSKGFVLKRKKLEIYASCDGGCETGPIEAN